MAAAAAAQTDGDVQIHPVAPLIRLTLLTLYLALVMPLPLLAPVDQRTWLLLALPLGGLLVLALLSERVSLDAQGICVGHPRWCAWLLRRGWRLEWKEVTGLMAVRTSQGGTVVYLRAADGRHLLLPQRVERLPEFLGLVQRSSGLDLSGIGRLTPPWTYWTLAILSGLILLGELITTVAVAAQPAPAA